MDVCCSLLPEFDNRKFESQVEQTRYLNLALFNGIAQGEINGNNRYFYHDRPVTATETMVFMARCLVSKEEMKQYGSDEAKKVALNCGIIQGIRYILCRYGQSNHTGRILCNAAKIFKSEKMSVFLCRLELLCSRRYGTKHDLSGIFARPA